MSYILVNSRPAKSRGSANCPGPMHQSQTLFRLFHNFPAPVVTRIRCARLIPRLLVQLGHLRGLIYSSEKGSPGHANTFIHFMEHPPLLTSNPEGTQLYIVGGRYRVTPRGIEG